MQQGCWLDGYLGFFFIYKLPATLHIHNPDKTFSSPSYLPYGVENRFLSNVLHQRSSQCWLWILISSAHDIITECISVRLHCTTDLYDEVYFLLLKRQSIHRIWEYHKFCLRSPNPALEPWESQSIHNIRYGSHNLFHHCGILISKSFCLHACVLHIQTMVTQILVQNSIILKTWKNYQLHSNKINLSWICACSKLRKFQDKSFVNSKIKG